MFVSLLSLTLLSPAADAAFDGKVKNIRVRLRNSSQSYRVSVVVQDDNVTNLDEELSVSVDFEPVGDAPELESLTVDDPTTSKATFVVEGLQVAKLDDDGTAPVDIVLLTAGGEKHSLSVNLPSSETRNASREVTFNETDKAVVSYRVDGSGSGRIQVRTVQDFDAEGSMQIVGVRVDPSEGYWSNADGEGASSVDAALQSTRSRLVTSFDSPDVSPVGHSYQVTTTLYDADGVAVDKRSEQIEIEGDGLDDGIVESKIRERKKGGYRMVTITGSDEALPVRALSTELTTADGEVLLSSFDEAPVNVARDFDFDGLTFSDDPSGTPYDVTIMLRDGDGSIIQTMDIIIENLENEDEVLDSMRIVPPDDSGFDEAEFSLYQVDKTTWDVGFGISGELAGTVADVVMQFNEPFEGPVPSENRLKLEFNADYHKWVNTFDPGDGFSDEELTVQQFMFTDEGVVVEEVMWTGSVGDGYKSGNGTRTDASNTSNALDLL